MKSVKLDLSKFKKVSSDGRSTTMKHEDGHQLVLSHEALDQKKLSALNSLPMLSQENKLPERHFAEGGPTSPDTGTNPPLEIEQVTPEVSSEPPPPAVPPEQPQAQTPAPAPSQPEQAAPAPEQAPPRPAQPEPTPREEVNQAFSSDKGMNVQHVAKEDAAIAHDLYNQHIKPETYGSLFAKKDTLGKIGTVFGLLMGGAGAGITHTENPLTAAWDKIISNDIDAQKNNISNEQTLFKLNRDRFPDIESAVNFTRMQQNRIALHDLAQKVNALPMGSAARAQAEQKLAIVGQFIDTQNANLTDQIASKQAFLNSTQTAGGTEESAFQNQQNMLRRGTPEQQKLAEFNEQHHVPGIPGQSSIALTPENRATLAAKQYFNDRLQDYLKFAEQNSGSIDPRIIAIGKAKANELSGLYRQATHGGVYKEGEAHFINQLIDAEPTKFFNVLRGVVPKAQELMQSNAQSLNNDKKALGFPIQHQAAPSGGQQPQYKIYNGVKYMRGPDGKAVPVQ